ncbi:MAG TPA: UDP-N-acetylmuramoyl-L-alanine--D-glutamate ligase [Candidatus Acidoferrales bacterium]|nr:UDP-N-acetylmuramoyl-L-alanine--D-glutamate ligase [Candidatus Acidoferrales bacterium]
MRLGVDLEGKRLLVVGLARTGVVVSLLCAAYGARVTATDEKPESALPEIAAKLRTAGVTLELGAHDPETFVNQDLIIISPGVPAKMPPLQLARNRGIPVWSEIELAWRLMRGKLVAITGSNGKTTTTALVGHILKSARIPVLIGGNIGTPLLARVEASSDSTVTVAEVSSFQLETIEAFRPDVGVLLNLTPDHIDRHGSFEEYTRAKQRLFENMLDRDAAVLNADDPEVARRGPAHGQTFWFSRQKRLAAGTFVRGEQILFRREGTEDVLMQRSDIPLRGEHNLENVLAASTAAILAGAPTGAVAAAVRTFPGVEHRLEYVAEINGVAFYNDSKATNVDATLKAIEAFPGSLFVILGGKDKGSPYAPLREPLHQKAKRVLLIGAAAEKIRQELDGSVAIDDAGTLERAVTMALDEAKPGDTVLLAPACSSFDQFENFEQRGHAFKQIVARLSAESSPENSPSTTRKG